jgi:signal transduction histidine kinase
VVEGQTVVSRVHNLGIGIPKEFQANIFQRFYRAPNVIEADVQGTGLGLNIAKMIVEKSGGEIGFTSNDDEGTTFYFRLPIDKQEAPRSGDQSGREQTPRAVIRTV